jgi:hypothetical protein
MGNRRRKRSLRGRRGHQWMIERAVDAGKLYITDGSWHGRWRFDLCELYNRQKAERLALLGYL